MCIRNRGCIKLHIVLTSYLRDLTKKDTDHASVEELDHNPQHVVLHVGKNEQSHAVAAARGTLLGEGGQDVPQEAAVGAEDQTVALDDFVVALNEQVGVVTIASAVMKLPGHVI